MQWLFCCDAANAGATNGRTGRTHVRPLDERVPPRVPAEAVELPVLQAAGTMCLARC